jgi:iron complex transport system ATP-binding protein
VLRVENISFGYSSGNDLFHDLSFSVDQGDVVCLLGPNGAGKTTLLRCLLGITKTKTGTIRLLNHDIGAISRRELARYVAYVPQATTSVFPHRVLDIVIMGRTPHLAPSAVPTGADTKIAAACLEELGILHLAHSLFSEISGGERQLTMIARALAQNAHFLIMDEPTSSLDYGNQVRILKVINQLAGRGYSILMTSHFPNHVFLTCNKVMMMKKGGISVIGLPDDVVTAKNLSELYATEVRIIQSENMKVCIPILC